jgi:hypothetical protein
VLTSVIFSVAGQAEEFFEVEGRREHRAPTMSGTGTGGQVADVPVVGALRRVVDDDPNPGVLLEGPVVAVAPAHAKLRRGGYHRR